MKKISLLILGILFLLSSCMSENLKPKDPIWGKENCSRCRMALSEKRYAVQRIFPSGEIHYYDDLNCAISHKHETQDEGKLYVRPFGGEEWVLATEAKYQSGLMTPMNSGYGAVKEGGTIDFTEIMEKMRGHQE